MDGVACSGLPGNRVEDAAMTESMGPIYDRTREHLGTTDVAIIFWRRFMLRLARNLEQGVEPAVLRDPNAFRGLPLQTTVPEADFGTVWQAHHDQYRAALSAAVDRPPSLSTFPSPSAAKERAKRSGQ